MDAKGSRKLSDAHRETTRDPKKSLSPDRRPRERERLGGGGGYEKDSIGGLRSL